MNPWTFDPLPLFGANIILADPPWHFETWGEADNRSPIQHYPTMTNEQIASLPVGSLASGDCACFLWVVDSLLDVGMEVLKGWGFRYATVAFTWAKRTRRDTGWHLGTGYYTRANPEMALLGMMGRLPRASGAVRQLIIDPVREHSRKPDRVRSDIEQLFGGAEHGVHSRVELFGRTPRAGWTVWGNDTDRFVEGGEPEPRMGSRRWNADAPAVAPLPDPPLLRLIRG